jgi:hypothetical protein
MKERSLTNKMRSYFYNGHKTDILWGKINKIVLAKRNKQTKES